MLRSTPYAWEHCPVEDDAGLQDTELKRETGDPCKECKLLDVSMDSSSHCSTTLSSEHSLLQSDKILLSSSTSATMQICCNMRSDAWYFKNAPQTLRTSVKKKLFLYWSLQFYSCKMRSLPGRGREVNLMKSKKVLSEGRATKQGKSLDVVSLFFCTIMEHHAGVLSKAKETTPHKDGVYTRAKPLGPVWWETPQKVKHPFALSRPDEWAWPCQQNTRLK